MDFCTGDGSGEVPGCDMELGSLMVEQKWGVTRVPWSTG